MSWNLMAQQERWQEPHKLKQELLWLAHWCYKEGSWGKIKKQQQDWPSGTVSCGIFLKLHLTPAVSLACISERNTLRRSSSGIRRSPLCSYAWESSATEDLLGIVEPGGQDKNVMLGQINHEHFPFSDLCQSNTKKHRCLGRPVQKTWDWANTETSSRQHIRWL